MLPEGLEPEDTDAPAPGGNKMRWGMPIPTQKNRDQSAKTCADREEQHPAPIAVPNKPNVHVVSDLRQDIVLSGWIQCYLKYSYPILND